MAAWFEARERDVPWRDVTDPYPILVAEVMAQQTRMETVGPYYRRFLDRFPDVEALAVSNEDEVLKLWEGLGYYSRARNLRKAAQRIVREHEGRVPEEVDLLRALPGVGPYTAGAVGSLAFGLPEPAIDGNARRVFSRWFDIEDPSPKRLESIGRLVLDASARAPGATNQAVMDLGSQVCTPRSPNCEECPVAGHCLALANGTVDQRPPKKVTARKPVRRRVTLLIEREGELLVYRRAATGLLGGLWDFPSYEESPATSLVEQVHADLGIEVDSPEELTRIDHVFSHFKLELVVHWGMWAGGEPKEAGEFEWAGIERLRQLAFPRYHRRLIDEQLAVLLSRAREAAG